MPDHAGQLAQTEILLGLVEAWVWVEEQVVVVDSCMPVARSLRKLGQPQSCQIRERLHFLLKAEPERHQGSVERGSRLGKAEIHGCRQNLTLCQRREVPGLLLAVVSLERVESLHLRDSEKRTCYQNH